MTVQPIETRYAGCRFRSRLEARWAVFFDHLGIEWEYEAQGYEVHGRPYLPDFALPDLGALVEVKGDPEKLDPHLLAGALRASGTPLGLILGRVSTYELGKIPCHWALFPAFGMDGYVEYGEYGKPSFADYDRYYAATSARDDLKELGERVLSYERRQDYVAFRCTFVRGENTPYTVLPAGLPTGLPSNEAFLNPRPAWNALPNAELKAAYEAARSARFEHGEKP